MSPNHPTHQGPTVGPTAVITDFAKERTYVCYKPTPGSAESSERIKWDPSRDARMRYQKFAGLVALWTFILVALIGLPLLLGAVLPHRECIKVTKLMGSTHGNWSGAVYLIAPKLANALGGELAEICYIDHS
jgi:hypothetical protein